MLKIKNFRSNVKSIPHSNAIVPVTSINYLQELPIWKKWFNSFETLNVNELDKYFLRVISPSLFKMFPSSFAVNSIFFRLSAVGSFFLFILCFFITDLSIYIFFNIYYLLIIFFYFGIIFTFYHIIKGTFSILKNLFNIITFNCFNNLKNNKYIKIFKIVLILILSLIFFCILIRFNTMYTSYIEIINYLDSISESIWTRYQGIDRALRYKNSLSKNINYPNTSMILKKNEYYKTIHFKNYKEERVNDVYNLFKNKGTFIFDYPNNFMHLMLTPSKKEGYLAFRGYHNDVFVINRYYDVFLELQVLSSKIKMFLSLIPIILIEKDIDSSLFYLKLTWLDLAFSDVYKYLNEPFMNDYFNCFKYAGLSNRFEDPLKFLTYEQTRANSIAAVNGQRNVIYNITHFKYWNRRLNNSLCIDFIKDIEIRFHIRDKINTLNYLFMPSFLNEILYHKNFFYGIIHLYSDRFMQSLYNLKLIHDFSNIMFKYTEKILINNVSAGAIIGTYWTNGYLFTHNDPSSLRVPIRDEVNLNYKHINFKLRYLFKIKLNYAMFLVENNEMLKRRNYPIQWSFIKLIDRAPIVISDKILKLSSRIFDMNSTFTVKNNKKIFKVAELRMNFSRFFDNKNIVTKISIFKDLKKFNSLKILNKYYNNSYLINNNINKLTINKLNFESDLFLSNSIILYSGNTGGGPSFWDMPAFKTSFFSYDFRPNPQLTKLHKIRNIDYKFCYNNGLYSRYYKYFTTMNLILSDCFVFKQAQTINYDAKLIAREEYLKKWSSARKEEYEPLMLFRTYSDYFKRIKIINYWIRRKPSIFESFLFRDYKMRDWRDLNLIFNFSNKYIINSKFSYRSEIQSLYLKNIVINKINPYLKNVYSYLNILRKSFLIKNNFNIYSYKNVNNYVDFNNIIPFNFKIFDINIKYWFFSEIVDNKKNFLNKDKINIYQSIYNPFNNIKQNRIYNIKIRRIFFFLAEGIFTMNGCIPPKYNDYLLSSEDRSLLYLNSKKLLHIIGKEQLKNLKLFENPVLTEFIDRINYIKSYTVILRKKFY